jgi:hypothetical protein
MDLEDVLRKVQSDRGNLLHGRLPLMSSRLTTPSWHFDAVGAVHLIKWVDLRRPIVVARMAGNGAKVSFTHVSANDRIPPI